MRTLYLILIFGLYVNSTIARSDSDSTRVSNKLKYFFNLQTGALVKFGKTSYSNPTTFSTSMVHGVRIHDRYNVGIGIGLDTYYGRGVLPLFVSLSRDLLGKKNRLFLELNYGGSYSNSLLESYGFGKSDPGPVVNPILGYSIRTDRLVVSFIVGYKFQRITDHYSYPYSIYNNDLSLSSAENVTIVQMDFSRMVFGIRVGLR